MVKTSFRDRFKQAKDSTPPPTQIQPPNQTQDPIPSPIERVRSTEPRPRVPRITEERIREIVREMIEELIPLTEQVQSVQSRFSERLFIQAFHILEQLSHWKKFDNDQPLSVQIKELVEQMREEIDQ